VTFLFIFIYVVLHISLRIVYDNGIDKSLIVGVNIGGDERMRGR